MTSSFRLSKLGKLNYVPTHFFAYLWTFIHSKCKRSSLRSQYWMRLFLRFSNTMHNFFLSEQKEELLLVGLENLLKVVKNWKVMMIIRSVLCIFSHAAKEEAFLDRETLLRFVKMKSTFSDPLINSCLSTKTVYTTLKNITENPEYTRILIFGAKIQMLH